MRPYLTLLVAALALAFTSGALWLSLRTKVPAREVPHGEPDGLLARFTATERAVATVRLASLLPAAEPDTLIDPAAALPMTHALPFDEVASLARAVASCRFPPDRDPTDRHLVKALEWHRFRCGQAPAPAAAFFTRPPFVHPSGTSYVRLAHGSGEPAFRSAEWVVRHLAFAHAAEWAALARETPGLTLDEPRRVLSELPADALAGLRDRDRVVLGGAWVLVARGGKAATGVAEEIAYDAFARAHLDRFLDATPFRLTRYRPGASFLARIGRAGWQVDAAEDRARTLRFQVLALAGLLALTAGAVGLAASRLSAGLDDARRRRFMLATLTHELRTPLASMSVSLEALREAYDSLPPRAQESFVRMCDDVARLGRVAETSRQYLRADGSRRLVDLKPVRVPSANELVEGWLERFREAGISWVPLDADTAWSLDPYWTEVCVTNLIDNALRHGRPPVRVKLERAGSGLAVSVQDAGAPAFADLGAMAAPFARGPDSTGTGLGLAIVTSIAGAMGGRLSYLPHPTRFVLSLSEAR